MAPARSAVEGRGDQGQGHESLFPSRKVSLIEQLSPVLLCLKTALLSKILLHFPLSSAGQVPGEPGFHLDFGESGGVLC